MFRERVGLREELDGADGKCRHLLLLVLSSIVVKVSRQPSDTAAGGSRARAVGKGMPSRLFARRAEELARQLTTLAERVPAGTPPPDVRLCDARRLAHLKASTVDRIVTSPPYLGTYDYAEQHARRFGWLGLSQKSMDAEIGARRRGPADALEVWQTDVDAFVTEFARVLKPGGFAYVVIGDSAVGTRIVTGDSAVRRAAEKSSLGVLASASQVRPNFCVTHRRAPRRASSTCWPCSDSDKTANNCQQRYSSNSFLNRNYDKKCTIPPARSNQAREIRGRIAWPAAC